MTETAAARPGQATGAIAEVLPAQDATRATRPLAWHRRTGRAARERLATTSGPAGRPAMADGMLKLMLILLALFILLHSRSEPSVERAAPILDSLALRFASTAEVEGELAARSTARHIDPRLQLRRRLLGHLPISAAEVEVPGALLAFDLHETALFAPDSTEIARERLVLLHRLAQALDEHETGRQSVLVVTTAWPTETTPRTAARLRRVQGHFADTSLDGERVRLGVASLPDGIWRFAIRAVDDHAA